MLGVDRLDYTKGLPQKLRALDKMLVDNPDWVGKVVMVQLCVPTRTGVSEYQLLRSEVEGLVGYINGKHGRFPSLFIPIVIFLLYFSVKSFRNSFGRILTYTMQATLAGRQFNSYTRHSTRQYCTPYIPFPTFALYLPSKTAST